MKILIRILNTLVALCCILIVAGMIWFLYLTFVLKYGGAHAVTHILNQFWGWWSAFWGWLGSFLP